MHKVQYIIVRAMLLCYVTREAQKSVHFLFGLDGK